MPHHLLELLLVQVLGGDFLVLFHAVYEETLKSLQEDIAEVLHCIGQRSLAQRRVGHSVFTDGIKEQLVTGLEIRAETFIENVDQLGKFNFLSMTDACPHLGRAGDLSSFSILADRLILR